MSGWRASLDLHPSVIPALEALLEAAYTADAAPPAISSHELIEDRLWRLDLLFTDEPDAERLKALLQEAADILGESLPPARFDALPDRDWVSESQKLLAPVTAGRFFVHGGHDRGRRRSFGVNLEIEAGQAFGTGQHATTRGCLLMIDRLARSVRPGRLLDLGCGSGVLGMAMAKVFHRTVAISDIDPIATRVAAENALLNHFPSRRAAHAPFGIAPLVAPGLRHRLLRTSAPYDLIVANILAPPLVAMATDIGRALRPGGLLILSGLLARQEARINAAYRNRGLSRADRIQIGDWPTLLLVKA